VTEIPEHLLRRSKERRAALSGEGSATEEAAAVTAETPRAAAPVRASAPAPETAAGGATPPARPRTVAAGPEAAPAPRPGPTRVKTPLWAMGMLLLLPLWAVVYMGAFGSRAKAATNSPVVVGAGYYNANCAACHGANGEGGVGPQLNNGAVLKQWPKLVDHLAWVHTGGSTHIGQTIGGVVVTAANAMPAFAGTLTDAQIADVVCYERVTFGGGPADSTDCPASS